MTNIKYGHRFLKLILLVGSVVFHSKMGEYEDVSNHLETHLGITDYASKCIDRLGKLYRRLFIQAFPI